MKEVKKWFAKAEKDLKTARANLKIKEFEATAFFAHQAAEKALKALYIKKFKRLWKIHDLEKLCSVLKADKKIIKISRELNPHYIETRYPVETKYTKKIAENALNNAKKVIKWVKEKLKK